MQHFVRLDIPHNIMAMAGVQAFGMQMLLAPRTCMCTSGLRQLARRVQGTPIPISQADFRRVGANSGLRGSAIEAVANKYTEVRVCGMRMSICGREKNVISYYTGAMFFDMTACPIDAAQALRTI